MTLIHKYYKAAEKYKNSLKAGKSSATTEDRD
jgi:hypothetical protein